MISQKIILVHFLEVEERDAGQADIFNIWQAWLKGNDYVYKREQLFPCQLLSPWWERHWSAASSICALRGCLLQWAPNSDFGASIARLQLWDPHRQSLSLADWRAIDGICWATWREALHVNRHKLHSQHRETSGNRCWSFNKKVNMLCPGLIALSGIAFSCDPREEAIHHSTSTDNLLLSTVFHSP